MIFVNFKTYKEASGENALELSRIINEVSGETGVEIIACPQTIDIKDILRKTSCKVWAQNTDQLDQGRATGWLPAKVLKEAGVSGTLLNHSEHKLSVGQLGETLSKCKEANLSTLVFADSPEEAVMASGFQPDFIGYEPPELIASKETSVAKAKPDIIEEVVGKVTDTPIVVGAGVKEKLDVEVSLKLGAKGVALSSAVILADDPKSVLMELAEGFK